MVVHKPLKILIYMYQYFFRKKKAVRNKRSLFRTAKIFFIIIEGSTPKISGIHLEFEGHCLFLESNSHYPINNKTAVEMLKKFINDNNEGNKPIRKLTSSEKIQLSNINSLTLLNNSKI